MRPLALKPYRPIPRHNFTYNQAIQLKDASKKVGKITNILFLALSL